MECASTAAYCFPSFTTVSPSVASAIDGAAPNNPANVFGLNRSEISENAETTSPPIANRRRISLKEAPSSSGRLALPDTLLKQARCFFWTFDSQHLELRPILPVIVHEKLLELLRKLLAEIVDVPDFGPAVCTLFDSDDAVIALFILLADLLALNYADHAAFEHATWESGFIHQHQHVDRVAIVGFR